jgi:hypothetical protein
MTPNPWTPALVLRRAAMLLLCAGSSFLYAAPPEAIELWLITASPDGSIARGVRMGADEMGRTTSLLGRRLALRELHAETAEGAGSTVSALAGVRQPAIVLLDMADEHACAVARALARATRVTTLAVRPAGTTCSGGPLQVRLPGAARERLLSQAAVRGARIDEWHSSLTRFGAGELNERFEKRTRQPMDGDAWAGWFAAKAGTEAILRLGTPTRAALTGDTGPPFDGHKGVPLRFDADGVLQQPMYLIEERNGGPATVTEIK